MCDSEGPSKSILESAMEEIAAPENKDFFRRPCESDVIDEEEVDEEDDLDQDFEPLVNEPQDCTISTVLGSRVVHGLHDEYSSTEASPSKKRPSDIRKIAQSFADITEDVLASEDPELQYDLDR